MQISGDTPGGALVRRIMTDPVPYGEYGTLDALLASRSALCYDGIMITSHRTIALLMAREIDPQPGCGDEYIHEWVPEHIHEPWDGGPDCAACWMHDYDQATKP